MHVPEEFDTKVSCPRCGWQDVLRTKREQLEPYNIYIWLAEIKEIHRKAHPNCSAGITDDLRIETFKDEKETSQC